MCLRLSSAETDDPSRVISLVLTIYTLLVLLISYNQPVQISLYKNLGVVHNKIVKQGYAT
ncbi:MAG: hypothetical protein D6B28_03635 [Gammaproteobacteria bacterium]|nr:MAG: hypothetical protein D6B28_03635 [Gammaproteobacteria bacterium]